MNFDESTHRIWRPQGKQYWFSSISSNACFGWMNCLYLHFAKEDFPQLKSPPLVDDYVRKFRFDYYSSPLNSLDFHGGITFYEETTVAETGRTVVKVGCDYQHYGDDEYQRRDYGADLLEFDAPKLASQFEVLMIAISKGETVTA